MDPHRWEKVKEIFEAAMDAAPEERSALVRRLASGDPEIEKEAKDLLSAANRAHDSFLVSPMDLGPTPHVFRPGEIIAGRYRIETFLAAGGMGEVYAAEDMLLRARIALKTILPAVVGEESAQRRFRQEIQTARRVAHANVCRVFDMGVHSAGKEPPRLFLTMELLEGETLSDLLKRCPQGMPLEDARPMIRAMCEALQAAHDVQVIHRDFKPANIFLTTGTGGIRTVVTDFGLARDNNDGKTESTRSLSLLTGGLMGSPAYMAPELFQGARANTASDLYALGVVMYQMATGQRPFSADTPFAEALQKQHGAQPASRVKPGVDRAWEHAIQQCLDPDPLKRPPSARAVYDALMEPVSGPLPLPAVGRPRRTWIPAAALCAAVAAAAAWFAWPRQDTPKPPAAAIPTALALVRPLTNVPGVKAAPSLTADGTRIAFSWTGASGDNWDIYLTPVDREQYTRLTSAPADDVEPAYAADGSKVVFLRRPAGANTNSDRQCVAESSMIVMAAEAGAKEQVVRSGRIRSARWFGPEELIWSECDPSGPRPVYSLYRGKVGGEHKRITSPSDDRGEPYFAISPDRKSLAMTRWLIESSTDVVLRSLDTGVERVLARDPSRVMSIDWSPDGTELIYPAHVTGLPRLSRLRIDGDRKPVAVSGVEPGIGKVSVAGQGAAGSSPRIVFDRSFDNVDLWHYDLTGASPPRPVHSTKRRDQSPRFAPDDRSVAISTDRYGLYDLIVADASTGAVRRLTENMTYSGAPAWSADGRWIVFDSMVGGSKEMYVVSSAGGQPRQLTQEARAEEGRGEFSRDGRYVFFRSNRGTGKREIWRIPFHGGPMMQITSGGGEECRTSPDGKSIYFVRREPGVWRVGIDGGTETRVLSKGYFGYWDVNANGIYYLDLSVRTPPRPVMFYEFATGTERRVATVERDVDPLAPGLAVSRDGKSLLVLRREKAESDLYLVEHYR